MPNVFLNPARKTANC